MLLLLKELFHYLSGEISKFIVKYHFARLVLHWNILYHCTGSLVIILLEAINIVTTFKELFHYLSGEISKFIVKYHFARLVLHWNILYHCTGSLVIILLEAINIVTTFKELFHYLSGLPYWIPELHPQPPQIYSKNEVQKQNNKTCMKQCKYQIIRDLCGPIDPSLSKHYCT